LRAMLLKTLANAEESPLIQADVPLPVPAKAQVLLQVLACGVCHTDLHIIEGDLIPSNYPVIPGHQVVGTVLKAAVSMARQY